MILGILASNIRAGGGLTHLMEVLKNVSLDHTEFTKIIVWASRSTLNKIVDKPFIEKRTHAFLDKSILHRTFWQKFIFPNEFQRVDLVFAPGGVFHSTQTRYVTMSQNMLVFQKEERDRYGFGWMNLRLRLLQQLQSKSIRGAAGVLFISQFAKEYITRQLNLKNKTSAVVYHGVHHRFYAEPTPKSLEVLKFLYVSIVDVYKHQNNVAKAVRKLIDEGCDIEVDFVGPAYPPSLKQLTPLLNEKVRYLGKVDYDEIEMVYKDADAFIFASSCENMPNILVEAMSSGKCILSSNMGPMPEILQSAGIYFNPLSVESIKKAIHEIYQHDDVRFQLATRSFELSKAYSWEKTANQTIQFLNEVACAE